MVFGLLCAAMAALPIWDARSVRGAALKGTLVEWTPKSLVLQTATGRVESPLDQLLELLPQPTVAAPETSAPIQIELADGSLLTAKSYSVREGRAAVLSMLDDRAVIPTSMIAWVQLAGLPEALSAEWNRLVAGPRDADLLLIRKGDTLDYHRGVIRDVSDAEILFEVDGDRLPVKRAKAAGLLYYHPPGRPLPQAVCRLTDAGGSRYAVQTLRVDGGQLIWTTPSGLTGATAQAAVQKIEFSSQRVAYLSDLTPEAASWTPYFAPDKDLPLLRAFYRPRQDRGFGDDGLRLGNQSYRKGLALHSKSSVTYRLPDRFHFLKAFVGIADAVRPRGKVMVVVLADDREIWRQEVSGEQPPVELNLEIGDVRRLTIAVDFAAAPGAGDQLLFCEARVVQ